MADESSEPQPFRLFSSSARKPKSPPPNLRPHRSDPTCSNIDRGDADADGNDSLADLGLSQWAVDTCRELRMERPTPVQSRCIPRILAGDDVLGIAQTGSGKTAAFALPILHRLAEDPYGVFALVVTPTRELACQLAEQFRALGSSLNVRCTLIVGGMDMLGQARALAQRPHVVVATPGRIKTLLEEDPDIPAVFSKTKFLVLDEADRVLDVGFEEELQVIFKFLPKSRQTLLFSATMTDELRALLEISQNRSYFYEAYEGSCHLLSLLLEELDQAVVALHSHKSQSLRLSALNRFKSGQVSVLVATDVASRGLDIPTVDLVINYDVPRYARDYVHRVGRTARAGRGGLSISFVTQNDVDLIHEIEAIIGKQLTEYECEEKTVLEDITKVYKARRVAIMKMIDDGFEEKAQARKKQKLKTLTEKGCPPSDSHTATIEAKHIDAPNSSCDA
ncbi:DEAD-box ATP-dependent RNA helicase [Musa troglodytarum]|uniref:DEAD-box ATP-dependent RNA helicase n=1 Tax=Musa troglodytarum TaxID=320322 RepID=A0A9E7K089_9LILI|nr:DEAD-box ATP-dependent RNA helicase [Musa troglodytarum]